MATAKMEQKISAVAGALQSVIQDIAIIVVTPKIHCLMPAKFIQYNLYAQLHRMVRLLEKKTVLNKLMAIIGVALTRYTGAINNVFKTYM